MWTHSKHWPFLSIWPIVKIAAREQETTDGVEVPSMSEPSTDSIGESHCMERGRMDDRIPLHLSPTDR